MDGVRDGAQRRADAGYGQSGAVEAVPIDALRRQFETNVLGYIRMAQLVLPGMRRQGWGRIVNLSSIAGRVTMPGSGVYSSSKRAIKARNPRPRYRVTAVARLLPKLRGVLPDRAWDGFLRTQATPPGKS